ncbi:glycosyltransferase family 2 protein [Cryobacterium sp. TMT1-21]|uniref:Glycosyltransferase family 2 protein n=1 Tax=Cryobacterium shii TaxID=1259235 RepID=A0AAQ2C5G3_9MICO|nr:MULTISPECIES: glycosyltransferase family 2 protein [Cryobacterium]TFC44959.1 glycosyltransferase family 2 protein [Cryobacterium shii]TFC89638.1 glycosyltransferase family 2 protein [Cryobacterium sp. TmT2-59]TFD11976.1 glycosyltransferase family 2 protein [Cryobacterium sp. TMT4-10]TFD16882.1 glycosyltransferase family 2 protein [Cryobacterium sp. TMT1-21]
MATEPHTPLDSSRVAVVTVSYGSEEVLGPFLASLEAAADVPLRVIVADNKPSQGSNAIATMTALAGAEYLPLASNRGYGQAINEAVKGLPAEIEWVVVSNPDVTAEPGSIDVLLAAVTGDSSIGAVGPRILSAAGDVYPSARTIPSLRSGVGHALFANLWQGNPWTRRYRRETGAELVRRDAGWLSGAFLLVRRSVFDQLNGFDESYFMYFEDVDLGYRIGKLGFHNVYEPSAVVVHTGAHSTQGESARMIRAHHDSAKRFLFKKYPGPVLFPLRLVLSTGLSIRARIEERRVLR